MEQKTHYFFICCRGVDQYGRSITANSLIVLYSKMALGEIQKSLGNTHGLRKVIITSLTPLTKDEYEALGGNQPIK